MLKRFLSTILAVIMFVGIGIPAYAADLDSNGEYNKKEQLAEIADKIDLNVEELQSLELNIQEGFEKLKNDTPEVKSYYDSLGNGINESIQEVKISDNLLLGVRTRTEEIGNEIRRFSGNDILYNSSSTYKVKSTSYIKHKTGLYNLVTCNAVGRFKSNGTPLYGSPTYSSKFWEVDTSSSVKDPYVVCNFDCRAYIGIDPVGMEVFSRSKTCSLWFSSSNKKGYASWD